MRIVLKPSRRLALTNTGVARYYNGPSIVSDVVRAKLSRYPAEPSEPWLKKMRSLAAELEKSGATDKIGLIKELGSSNPEVRSMAAISIAYGSTERSFASVIPFLILLLEDPTQGIAITPANAAELSLSRLGPSAAEPLVQALESNNPVVRRHAAYALNNVSPDKTRAAMAPTVLGPLIQRLSDDDADVRAAAAHALQWYPDSKATAPLIRALKDPNPEVRANAAIALHYVRDASAFDPLVAAIEDERANVRSAAVDALTAFETPKAFVPLLRAMSDSDANVRGRAAWALVSLKDLRATPAFIKALRDPVPLSATGAAFGLGELKAAEAIDPLIDAMNAHREGSSVAEPNLRREAARALAKITGQNFGEDADAWRQWRQEHQ
jgi:HEAT repeat protein